MKKIEKYEKYNSTYIGIEISEKEYCEISETFCIDRKYYMHHNSTGPSFSCYTFTCSRPTGTFYSWVWDGRRIE